MINYVKNTFDLFFSGTCNAKKEKLNLPPRIRENAAWLHQKRRETYI